MTRARKRFGQHFLEAAWVDKVIRTIAPQRDEVFVEVGPGRGALTVPLAARAGHVCAVEIDRDLVTQLRDLALPNLTVLEGDFLALPAATLTSALSAVRTDGGTLRVAGNLPYNVASPILFALVALADGGLPFADATVMLQREVADRLTAGPGTGDYGVLSVLIGHRARAERVLALPPGAFRPPPQVNSALVRLVFHAPEPPARRPAEFAAMVHAIFTRRRKTLANALLAYAPTATLPPVEALRHAEIDGRRRPETLSIAEMVRLADTFADR